LTPFGVKVGALGAGALVPSAAKRRSHASTRRRNISGEPPEPDIACSTFAGERLAFELAELCTPEVAKAVGDDSKRGGGVSFMRTTDPSRDVLLKKLVKRYASAGPVDLLCYADGYLVTPDDVSLEELRATLGAHGLGHFRSVWFHGEKSAYRVG
jgi:hypothetical protein